MIESIYSKYISVLYLAFHAAPACVKPTFPKANLIWTAPSHGPICSRQLNYKNCLLINPLLFLRKPDLEGGGGGWGYRPRPKIPGIAV